MKRLVLFLALATRLLAVPEPPTPESVVVIYNSTLPESKKLAATYAIGRGIPEENLVGLDLPDQEEISRAEYDHLVRGPLVGEFNRRKWWTRRPDAEGTLAVRDTPIRILCCMRGVPSRILHPVPPGPDGKPAPFNAEEHQKTESAAVDSELGLLGVDGYPLGGPLRNPYFEKDEPFAGLHEPIFLVGRIDGPSFAVCQRMIRDALAAEESGLWGMAVIDIAHKSRPGDPNGDPWLVSMAAQLTGLGIPTLVDSFKPTLPVNFPLRDTALYFGWYDWNVSGPFANPAFQFRRGAVAAHLHSFSAAQLRNPKKHWCAPLLAHGAAATLGNVYEPFLHLTHHFDIFQQRLLDGYTLVEAASMSMPVLSWQGLVLGDPLYRPFLHLDGSGRKRDEDAAYRALRIARMRWGDDPAKREAMLRSAGERMKSGVFLEAIGLEFAAHRESARAGAAFLEAKGAYRDNLDKLRMDLLVAKLDREGKRKAAAIKGLRDARLRYAQLPEAKAAAAWLNIIDPPPPPPAKK